MDAVGIGITAVGMFLLYSAVKDHHPWSLFTTALGVDSGTGTATGQSGTPATPGTTAAAQQSVSSATQVATLGLG